MNVDKFIYENKYLISKISAYYNLDKEELYQEIYLSYYEDEAIDEFYISGEKRKANSLFAVALRKALQKYSITGIRLVGRNAYLKALKTKEVGQNTHDVKTELQKTIDVALEEKEDLRKIQEVLTPEEYTFVLNHYDVGGVINATAYGISQKAENKRVSRLLIRIREQGGLL